jgi:short-subunit dehydrogenase
MKPLVLQDSWALVTGASSGIGREIARLLGGAGANVVLIARRAENLWNLQYELRHRFGAHAVPIVADLADPAAVEKIRERTSAATDRIDLLVHNAGFGYLGDFAVMPSNSVSRMIEVNATAPIRLTRVFLPAMIERQRGGILTIASLAALQPAASMSLYAATKAMLLSFSEALHHEVRRHGIRVSCICPGPVRTEFFAAGRFDQDPAYLERRASPPEHIARLAIASVVTGRMTTVPGLRNRFLVAGARFVPRSLRGAIARTWNQRRRARAVPEKAKGEGSP